ncbi:divalent-cation tolerance protein CutA [Alteraurantiacibacter aestuarii]|uniref:divalent-cation tolerance protein CutA n=1 Tax=Alteraurantiacibacter aestuarii TaxID=650004 RepID=UPI00301BB048
MSEGPALIWCPFPSEEEARRVAGQLLDERLIACANIVPGMISIFEWQGERGEAREVGVLLKTHGSLLEKSVARLADLHSYDTPAVAGWITTASAQATSAWIDGLTGTEASR